MGWFRRLLGLDSEKQPQPTAPEMPKADTAKEVMGELPPEAAPVPAVTTPLSPPTASSSPPTEPLKGPIDGTRPLPPQEEFKSKYRRMRYGSASDIGGRGNNEDAAITIVANADVTNKSLPIGLFAVADGMGGHENGEFASAITVQTLAQHVTDDVILPQVEGKQSTSDSKTVAEVLAEALESANEQVQANYPGGGTTATCAVIRGDLAHIAHVGDSRAYLYANDTLELITRDHLLVRRLQELGQLSAEEAEVHPQRNVLYRAIGQAESLEVDAATRRLPPSSRLLLCSDGLWGVIGDAGILEILRGYSDPQEACERLIDAVNALKGQDNITAVIVQMPE